MKAHETRQHPWRVLLLMVKLRIAQWEREGFFHWRTIVGNAAPTLSWPIPR